MHSFGNFIEHTPRVPGEENRKILALKDLQPKTPDELFNFSVEIISNDIFLSNIFNFNLRFLKIVGQVELKIFATSTNRN